MNRVESLQHTPPFPELHSTLAASRDSLIEEAVNIQQIPAPTFQEAHRAAYVEQRFRQIQGLCEIEQDALHNVYARLPGTEPSRGGVLVSAHTDTVFSAETVLDIRREGSLIHGPGIGDNSLGVAALIEIAALMAPHQWPADIWFVANSREEGLGDLGGIRAVRTRLQGRFAAAIVIEGMALGRIYHAGIAVRRLQITCNGPGGHSWLHAGRASAVHGLVQLAARITALRPPQAPRSSLNIGVIQGGTTVNTIAAEAKLLLDLRSEAPSTLADLENSVRALVRNAAEDDGGATRQRDAEKGTRAPELTYEVSVVGDRPAGAVSREHPLVQWAHEVLLATGKPPTYETGSTDANALLAAGIPSVTLGVTQGGNAHRLDEYIDTGPLTTGMWQLLLTIGGAATGAVSSLAPGAGT